MSLFDIFKKRLGEQPAPRKRSFAGAARTRFTKWINSSLTKVNADLNEGLLTTVTRCRDLAKNEPVIRSYLGMCQKNIIGKARLHSSMPTQEE